MATLSLDEFECLIHRLSSLSRENGRLEESAEHTRNKNAPPAISNFQNNLNVLQPVLKELVQGNKILAIKLVRELTGIGLKEAKNVVEGNPLNYSPGTGGH